LHNVFALRGSEYNRGTGCGKTARPGLCGGRWVTGVPTARNFKRYFSMKNEVALNEKIVILAGFALLLSTVGPVTSFVSKLSGLIHMNSIMSLGSLAHIISFFSLKLLICLISLMLIFKQFNFFGRLNPNYSSFYVLAIGCSLFLAAYFFSLFSYDFGLHRLKNEIVFYTKSLSTIILYIGCAIFLVGIYPNENK
jgi:hypothetical protein